MFCCRGTAALAFLLTVFSTTVKAAEDVRYVTDDLEITLHRSMSLSSDIVTQLKSGTPVRVLKTNRESFSKKIQS